MPIYSHKHFDRQHDVAFSISKSKLGFARSFNFFPYDRCKMLSHCSFNLQLQDYHEVDLFFSQLLAFQVSSVKYSFFYCDFVFPLLIYEEVLYFLDIILCQLCEL